MMKAKKQNRQLKTAKELAASWGRSAAAAAIAYYLATGDMTAKGISSAALAAVLPPILRFLNPKDPLGRG
jgi:aryl-alcohol dehydrogenase-like predicted oxidoreductase